MAESKRTNIQLLWKIKYRSSPSLTHHLRWPKDPLSQTLMLVLRAIQSTRADWVWFNFTLTLLVTSPQVIFGSLYSNSWTLKAHTHIEDTVTKSVWLVWSRWWWLNLMNLTNNVWHFTIMLGTHHRCLLVPVITFSLWAIQKKKDIYQRHQCTIFAMSSTTI